MNGNCLLLSNGVSIAYNNALTTDALTTELLRVLLTLAPPTPICPLPFAASLTRNPGNEFEASSNGPLSTTAEALAYLPGIAVRLSRCAA